MAGQSIRFNIASQTHENKPLSGRRRKSGNRQCFSNIESVFGNLDSENKRTSLFFRSRESVNTHCLPERILSMAHHGTH